MKWARLWYWLFVIGVVVLLVMTAIPILASDLFRQPYHPTWATINDLIARFQYTYNPSGGGQPPRFPRWRDPADAGIYFRQVKLTTADGLALTGWYVPAVQPVGPPLAPVRPAMQPEAPTVLLAHGLLDSKWHMLRLVPWLHEAGYNVMLVDFRGHGGSDKQPTTVGREEVLDIQAALDWLEDEGAGEWVAGLGMSLGAASLVNTAIQDPRLDALILDSMFADWSDVNYAEEYRLSPDWIVPGVPSPVELLPNLEHPVLIIHGTADILTHVDHAYRLYNAANEPKELWINDSGHAWSAWTYPDRFQEKVLSFLEGAQSPP